MVGELTGRFVILAAAHLADQGLLDFRRTLGSYLPALGAKGAGRGHLAEVARLQVGTVAAEATGRVDIIPRLVPGYRLERNLLPALAARADRFPPGFRQSWSCGMNDLLGLLLQHTRRQPWTRVLATEVLQPLGMTASACVAPPEAAKTVPFYFPEGTRYDPRLVESLLPPMCPSLSLRTTLGDLTAGGSALLAGYADLPGAALPSRLVRRILEPAIPGQLDRQGFETGLGWNLTDYRLAHLGRVAWVYGSAITHQTYVLLLPDRGMGVVVTQTWHDPAGLYDLKRIARALVETWAEQELNLPRPEFQVPSVILPIPEEDRPVPGLYASEAGMAEVGFEGDQLTLSIRGGYGAFAWAGKDMFLPTSENEYGAVEFQEGRMTVTWRSGARATLAWVPAPAQGLALESGSFPVEVRGSVQSRGTAMIDQREGHWTITGDDGQSYLLLPEPGKGIRVLCDQASALFGCRVTVDGLGAVHILAQQ
jgi:CubicO group peptidase (beta-lactamase class C family)